MSSGSTRYRRFGVSLVLCLLVAGVDAAGAGVLLLSLEIRVGRGGVGSSAGAECAQLSSSLDVDGCGVSCDNLASSLLVTAENSLRRSCSDSADELCVEFLCGVSTGDIVGAGHSDALDDILGAAALLSLHIIGGVANCVVAFRFFGGIL